MTSKETNIKPWSKLDIEKQRLFKLIAKEWLTLKIQQEQKTREYLEVKARTDVIHRTMWLMSGAEIECMTKLIEELKT